ncbi:CRISPR-associated protein Cas5 [Methanobrevibacter olleyae]|uniref:CRISPR-associated protein Cas5 Hmari subtype n=1 Tax=Methanobrevibacter olleyae TaxID=294671 RepID=A0A126QZ44_METOL|nr:CRISPR-associated protein Cas5 [Methanobrevibacter olleyae]AMK14949.1 CRISPR-associated protein Cas5 Hmari subtype [Methanobrevibacter olleyae]
MNFSNIIELDIWSKFGCFSKPFSNSGGILTYFIPPKTSIIGMIGSVLGYSFDDFIIDEKGIKTYSIEKFNDIKVSIQPLFSLKTKRVTYNNVSGEGIKNIHQDVLLKPHYKIFISFPDSLKDDESLFLDRIKKQMSVFNLYMGKNEFLLNFEFKNVHNYESYVLNVSNKKEFFSKNKIYGSLNRKNIKSTTLKSEKENIKRSLFSRGSSSKLESYYEYFIHDYPIKRENFVKFTYSPISFYTYLKEGECYFSDLELKEDCEIELCKIGDKKWISLI